MLCNFSRTKMLRSFSEKKFHHACHANRSLGYYTYYPVLQENVEILVHYYFKDL